MGFDPNVSGELSSTVQRLTLSRAPLIATKQQIDLLDAQLARSNAERDKLLELMRNFNRSRDTDQNRWNVFNDEFQFEGNRIAEALGKRAVLQMNLVEGATEIRERLYQFGSRTWAALCSRGCGIAQGVRPAHR